MFYNTEQLIDQVQNTKKTVVNTIVFDKNVRDASIEMIEAQTKIAKLNAKFAQDSYSALVEEGKRIFEQAKTFDYSKLFKQPEFVKTEQ